MQKQEVEHTNQLSRMQHEEKLGQNTKDVEVDIESERKKNGEKLNYLRSLKDLGVDLNGYLSSLNPRPDQLIQINGADANPTNMHIHSEAKPKK